MCIYKNSISIIIYYFTNKNEFNYVHTDLQLKSINYKHMILQIKIN